MTEKIIRRLGVRLNHLYQWVDSNQGYDEIWDLCCDHGRLGLHLHQHHIHSRVYLVDKVAAIVDKLAVDYASLNDGRIFFKCADARELQFSGRARRLVIVAGVGGQSLMAMLEGIIENLDTDASADCTSDIDRTSDIDCTSHIDSKVELDFLLSPNSHTFELRGFLQANHFGLIDEAFISENGFSHEHLWLRYNKYNQYGIASDSKVPTKPVTAIGDSLWLDMTDVKRRYLDKLVQHYQRMRGGKEASVAEAALAAYGRVL